MKLTLENMAIIAGGLAIAYAINKVVKKKQTGVNQVQYSPAWADDITGNTAKDNLIYV